MRKSQRTTAGFLYSAGPSVLSNNCTLRRTGVLQAPVYTYGCIISTSVILAGVLPELILPLLPFRRELTAP